MSTTAGQLNSLERTIRMLSRTAGLPSMFQARFRSVMSYWLLCGQSQTSSKKRPTQFVGHFTFFDVSPPRLFSKKFVMCALFSFVRSLNWSAMSVRVVVRSSFSSFNSRMSCFQRVGIGPLHFNCLKISLVRASLQLTGSFMNGFLNSCLDSWT